MSINIPTQLNVMRVRHPGAGPSTCVSAAVASSTLPSNHSGAHGRLSTPGRRREDESHCQADKRIADWKLRSDWKGEQSQRQHQMWEWRKGVAREGRFKPSITLWSLSRLAPIILAFEVNNNVMEAVCNLFNITCNLRLIYFHVRENESTTSVPCR